MKLLKAIVSTVLTAIIIYESVLFMSLATYAENERYESSNSEIVKTLAEYNGDETLTETKWYVCDVMIGSGTTLEDAENAVKNKGYLPYPQNTNESGAGLATCVGYKLTQDKSRAITALAVMNQDGGYKVFDYKSFLANKVPGLQKLIKGMMAACNEMRNNIANHNEAAILAKEFLNLYHVPGDDNDSPEKRTLLGNYILDKNRTYDDFEKLILLSNTDALMNLNAHLGVGCNDCTVAETQKIYYGNLEKNETWLQDAFDAVLNHPYLFCLQDDTLEEYWLYLMDQYYSRPIIFENSLKNNVLSEKSVAYLKSIVNTAGTDGKPKTIAGKTYDNLYDFLNKVTDSDSETETRLMYAFANALPAGLDTQYFVDILNAYCAKGDGKLYGYYTKSPEVESAWMMKAADFLRQKGYSTTDVLWITKQNESCAGYRDEIVRFTELIQSFAADYRKACVAFGNVSGVYPDAISEEDADNALEKAKEMEKNGVKVDIDCLTDDLFVMSAYTMLAKYNIVGDSTVLEGYQVPPEYADITWVNVEPTTNQPRNLGEYLLLIADYTGANDTLTQDVKNALALPLYSMMTEGQRYILSANGLTSFFNYGGDAGEAVEEYRLALEEEGAEFKKASKEQFGTETTSVWFGSHADLYDLKNLYQTNRSIRSNAAKAAFDAAQEQDEKAAAYSKYLSRCSQWIGIASGIAGVTSTIIGLSIKVGVGGMFKAVGSVVGGLLLKKTMAETITATTIGASLGCVFFVASLLLLVAFLVVLILSLVPPGEPDVVSAPIPEIMVDTDNSETTLVRYDVVRDQNGDPGDFNKNSQRRWVALYYSKEEAAGSPLMAVSDTDVGFAIKHSDTKAPDKMVPLTKFGETVAFNLNNDQKNDKTGGIYMFYTTYNSANGIADARVSGKYISAITLAISKNEESAKKKILTMAGFKLLNTNLTAESKAYYGKQYYTYLGYSTTDIRSKAVTDIRASFVTDAEMLCFGDSKYINAVEGVFISCPLSTVAPSVDKAEPTPFYYQLYYTTSTRAGDPILADSLRTITDLKDLKPNEEYARCFSGEAFDPQVEIGYLTGNPEPVPYFSEKALVDPVHHFIAFSDEKPKDFDGSKTYLAGMSFFYGSRLIKVGYWAYNPYYPEQEMEYRTYNEQAQFVREAKLLGMTIIDVNLTPVDGICSPGQDLNGNADNTYMGYSVTNNPKKAAYSVEVFVGEAYRGSSNRLASNISKKDQFYEASNIYVCRSRSHKIEMRYSHAYVSTSTDELDTPDFWGGDRTYVRQRGLYILGPTANTDYGPILLEDVIMTTDSNALPTKNGKNESFTDLNGKKLNGGLKDNYRSVHAIYDTFHDVYDAEGQLLTPGTDLGFPEPDYATSLFIYFRSGDKKLERGTYISSVEFAGRVGESSAYETAIYYGLAYGQEIIGLEDPLGIDEETAFHITDYPFFNGNNDTMPFSYWLVAGSDWGWYPYEYSALYLSVSYTNRETEALGTVIVYSSRESENKELPISLEVKMNDEGVMTRVQRGKSTVPIGKRRVAADDPRYSMDVDMYQTIYSSRNGTRIGRLSIVRKNEIDLELNGRGYRYLSDEKGNRYAPYEWDNGDRQSVIMIDADRGGYIGDIVAFDDMETEEKWNSLLGEGYQEMIAVDALGGLSSGRVHFAIKRTSSPIKAIKDIICAPQDYGEKYEYGGREYKRVNSFSISRGVPLASEDVFIYVSNGNVRDNSGTNPVYLAVCELGIMIDHESSYELHWNGTVDVSQIAPERAIIASGINGSSGQLDGNAFGSQDKYLRKYTDEQYSQFRNESGKTHLVYTNMGNRRASDFGQGLSGAIATLGADGAGIVILSVVFTVCVGVVVFFAVKRRGKKE